MLFKNCLILTKKDGEYKLVSGYLGVDGEYIDYIGAETPIKHYDYIKDFKGKLLMPGLVNAHGHSAMTLLRGVGSGLPLDRWLNEAIFPIEAKMTPRDIMAGNKLAIAEMLSGGTTQLADMYDFPFAGAAAYADTGMKVNLCRVGLCFNPELEAEDLERIAECIDFVNIMEGRVDINDELVREIEGVKEAGGLPENIKKAVQDKRIIADYCLHSEYLTSPEFVKAISEANKTHGVRVHLHLSETKKEHEECIARHGMTPAAYFAEMGIFDQPTYAAHCVWVTDEDREIIKHHDVTIVHNPTSNLKLGSGIAGIPAALKTGINVALGTDGAASNNNLNMFEEMHLAALIHKGIGSDLTLISEAQILDMATVNGAKALGRPDTGELLVGKKADIIALDIDKPHMLPHPTEDILALLCYSAQASDVTMTMADGRILYEDGEYTTIDIEKIRYEFAQALERLR